MLTWITNNKAGLATIGSALVLFVALNYLGGCSGGIGQWVKMPVPQEVQRVTGSPAIVPIDDYAKIRKDYLLKCAEGTEELDANYNDSMFWFELISIGVNTGVDVGTAYASTAVPGGGLLVGIIGALGGLMLRRPGDQKTLDEKEAEKQALKEEILKQARDFAEKLKDEKIASYNKGKEDAQS